MIRPLSTRDSSLRSEWHTGEFFVILNELLGEEESLLWVRVRSSETFIGFQNMIRPMSARDSSLRSEWQAGEFFVILDELLGEEESLQYTTIKRLNSYTFIFV